MMRTFAVAAVALFLSAGLVLAADKKPEGQPVQGVIKKVDAEKGTITVTVKNKKETADKEFTIGDATKVMVMAGEDKKEMVGKAGLKAEQFKEGAMVGLMLDKDGKVMMVKVGEGKKKKDK